MPSNPLWKVPYRVDSPYFEVSASIVAFDVNEMIGTKIRALYQRNKGRDLFDLFELGKLSFDWDKIVESFQKLKTGASKMDYEKNLNEKMSSSSFLGYIQNPNSLGLQGIRILGIA